MVQVLELHELGREVGLDLHPRLVATVRTHSPPDHIGFIVLGLEVESDLCLALAHHPHC